MKSPFWVAVAVCAAFTVATLSAPYFVKYILAAMVIVFIATVVGAFLYNLKILTALPPMLVITPILALGSYPEAQYNDMAFYAASASIVIGVVSGYALITRNFIQDLRKGLDSRKPNDE